MNLPHQGGGWSFGFVKHPLRRIVQLFLNKPSGGHKRLRDNHKEFKCIIKPKKNNVMMYILHDRKEIEIKKSKKCAGSNVLTSRRAARSP